MLKNNPFEAIEELYEAHYTYLRHFLIGLTKSDVLADDIIQDIFAKLLMEPKRLETVRHHRSWLIQIAKNALIDHYRKKQPDLLGDDSLIETLLIEHFTPEQNVIQQTEMVAMLADLAKQDKAIILAKEYYGYTYEEMNSLFNIPVSTLKSKIFRARKSMMKKRWRHE